MSRIETKALESYLWGAANVLRGHMGGAEYKQYIFPMLFWKRICDTWNEERQEAIAQYGEDFPENHKIRVPQEAQWDVVRNYSKNIGSAILEAMRLIESSNPSLLRGVFGDAQWTNKEKLPDETLRELIEHFSSLELSLSNLPEDELGTGYEFLIRKFADDSGHTAAEFYTNRTVVHLMIQMLKPQSGEEIYDPTCGSGGMLISSLYHLKQQGIEHRNIGLYGQEINLLTSAIARMNLFLHGVDDFDIQLGDTLADPKFVDGGELKKFDLVLANPPYSIKNWNRAKWISDKWGRNNFGTPPQGNADYAFFQHILSSMKNDNGRCAILFPHGILFRKQEKNMRQKVISSDLIECVIGLGPKLFYNSPMESCIVICRNNKSHDRRGKVLFIDAIDEISSESQMSFLENEHIERISDAYHKWENQESFCSIVSIEDIMSKDSDLSVHVHVEKNKVVGEISTLFDVNQSRNQSSIQLRNSMTSLFFALERISDLGGEKYD
jgi:type I restriction enzyme M protein